MAGRPSKLTPALQKQICALAVEGLHLQSIADAVGLDEGTLRDWKKRGEKEPDGEFGEFSRAYKKALVTCERALLESVKTAEDGWQRFSWCLERRWPEKYRLRNPDKERLEIAKLRSEVALLRKAAKGDEGGELKVTLAYGQPTSIDHT